MKERIQTVHYVFLGFTADEFFRRAVEVLEIPEAALLIADVAPMMELGQREEGIGLILGCGKLGIERADSVFMICKKTGVRLTIPELLAILGEELEGESDGSNIGITSRMV
jgi:hypothetical protein